MREGEDEHRLPLPFSLFGAKFRLDFVPVRREFVQIRLELVQRENKPQNNKTGKPEEFPRKTQRNTQNMHKMWKKIFIICFCKKYRFTILIDI